MIAVIQPGLVDYATALELQQSLVDLRKQSRIPDTLLLLEHPAVITLGRNSRPENLLVSRGLLRERAVELYACNRGGDVTFHGPGQLVGYPIFDLRSQVRSDLGEVLRQKKNAGMGAVQFVRLLEEALIRTCVEFGVNTQRMKGLTGVWTTAAAPAKVAAIGIHISRGVTSHGFALNLTTDLEYFKLIVPCGITGHGVTSLAKEISGPRDLSTGRAAEIVARNFGKVFASQILWLDSLEGLLAAEPGEDISDAGNDVIDTVPGPGLPANQDVPLQVPDEIRRIPAEPDPSKERFWA